ncbi:MAG: carbon-nitrogen hydrolase [Gammaproteobacteria bacterium]|nr:carbon-nitrogen hydrolase [Gammaproteobacteria bacterium]
MSRAPRPRPLEVGLVQMAMSESPDENLARAEGFVRDAAGQGARLVVLPELFRSRYFCQSEDARNFDLAEPVPGPSTERLGAVAAELGVTLVASLFERRAPGLYHNTAAVLDGERGYVGKYRKMHIPDDPRYYEKFYFTPGDLGFRTFHTAPAELGVLVCWDQWYPEAARLTALRGAELLIYPTAIGWHPEEKAQYGERQHEAWETMQRSHAIANGCFVVAVNRVGFEPDPAGDGGIEFWGRSFIAAPDGRVLVRAPGDAEAVIVERVDLNDMESFRVGWPFLRDRRIDAYSEISERFIGPENG